ncbi:hypothetical protein SERLADRAFT_407115 [Serpula lacrymans var. lacrymans S7.9]|uniref:Uncharacterized protein n=1 Tax=Serpula lacrymans var. lacrymans (strain S7.9) TaxID=578457 RepID=F8NRL2_SERL9|nr:uncharacterized protein SERLADRAFT_407115 [Serpula lacrymans var. lacrymans S7.9]EGO26278.1 hypothetical protein SERLADRAFT_407115 [Serpula lacrymans var. lacrymans S7.9]
MSSHSIDDIFDNDNQSQQLSGEGHSIARTLTSCKTGSVQTLASQGNPPAPSRITWSNKPRGQNRPVVRNTKSVRVPIVRRIARHVFKNDSKEEFCIAVDHHRKQFGESVQSRLDHLGKKYKECVRSLSGTGAGLSAEELASSGFSNPIGDFQSNGDWSLMEYEDGSLVQMKVKLFNINTYKIHAIGDYTTTIQRLGTTDSYTTQIGELEHRNPKACYTQTSRKFFTKQIAKIERHQTQIRQIQNKLLSSHRQHDSDNASISASIHHFIGTSQNNPVDIDIFLRSRLGDPATKGFLPKLRSHVLPRLKDLILSESGNPASAPLSTNPSTINNVEWERPNILQE